MKKYNSVVHEFFGSKKELEITSSNEKFEFLISLGYYSFASNDNNHFVKFEIKGGTLVALATVQIFDLEWVGENEYFFLCRSNFIELGDNSCTNTRQTFKGKYNFTEKRGIIMIA